MSFHRPRPWLPAAALLLAAAVNGPAAAAPEPPVARQVPWSDTCFGEVRHDPYHWLRDRHDPAVLAHLEAENRYMAAVLEPTAALQETLSREMLSRIRETDLSVPARDGPYFYYTRTEQGLQYPIYCRRRGSLDGPEEVLLDVNVLARDHAFCEVGALAHSPDHRRIAYTVDLNGSERYALVVQDLATGRTLPDRVEGVEADVAWGDDGTLFYLVADEAKRPWRLMRHVLGEEAARDARLVEEPDPLFNLDLAKSRDRRWIVLTSSSFETSEVRVVDCARPLDPPRLVRPRVPGVMLHVVPHGDTFFLLTNQGAVNFRVARAPAADPAPARETPFLPERKDYLIEGLDAFRDFLAVYERGEARQRITIVDLRSGTSHVVPFDEPVFTFRPAANPEFDTHLLRFSFLSPITPETVIDYDMATGAREVRKRLEVPNYDPSLYATERVWATARDGVRVPISLLYRKPLRRDGTRPLLLYGYGAYGISSDPRFDPNVFSLLDRGFVYAIAHVRGGQEMGRPWYDDGKLERKRNTFDDFIACAEHLIADRTTARDRLAIRGGSAGGLLVGAVLNLRPELFRAAVADVPFVDLITTMKDPTIPLTTQEWEQWGDPRREPDYGVMRAYSPYDNVAARPYPSLLVTAGLNDPRVGFWEPTKWVARLRATGTARGPILLKVNLGAGHHGASGRYDALRDVALRYAFLLWAVGPGHS